MPTLAELLVSTQTKFDTAVARLAELRQEIVERQHQVTQVEQRVALLKTRLEALDALAKEWI